jgi:armadillo repeat-containing protein 7
MIFFWFNLDPANAAVIIQSGGIPLVIQCLSSPVRNTVRILSL